MTSGSLRILTSFAEDYISKIEALKSEWNVDQILERDFEKRRHGFHLAMQIVMAAYNELIEAKEVIPLQEKGKCLTSRGDFSALSLEIRDESFVPETMEICESSPIIESTCCIVPETQTMPATSHQGLFWSPDKKLKRKKSPQNVVSKIREPSDKYNPLSCLQNERNNETTSSLGALGTGPNPTKAPKNPRTLAISDGESPSLLRPSTSRKIEKAVQIDDEDEYENDFKEAAPFKTKDVSPPLKKQKSKDLKKVKCENRFGINVDTTTDSQKKRLSSLKQQSISKYAIPGNDQSLKRPGNEMERVLALSVESAKIDDEKRKNSELRSPLKKLLLDDSFDSLPGERKGKRSPDFKYVGSPVRKKLERKALPAFECRECRDFYAGANLTEEKLKELLQKCSRHRSKNPPLASSPQYCWDLDLRPDSSQDKTQTEKPLRTRKRKEKFLFKDQK